MKKTNKEASLNNFTSSDYSLWVQDKMQKVSARRSVVQISEIKSRKKSQQINCMDSQVPFTMEVKFLPESCAQ